MLIDVKATAAYNSGGQRTTRPLMLHRHLNHQAFTLAAIEDVIARGHWEDWAALRQAILCDPSLLCKVERVCHPYVGDPFAQRHQFWMRHVEEHRDDARLGPCAVLCGASSPHSA